MLRFIPLAIVVILNCNHLVSANSDGSKCLTDLNLPEGCKYTKSEGGGSEKGSLGVIGDVNDVLQGVVKDNVKDKEWTKENSGIAGIGAATLGKWGAVGEAVFINGMAIIRSADNGSADYYKTLTGPKFKTQFSVFVTNGAKKDGEFTVNNKEGVTMTDFYNKLYESIDKKPFCFVGVAKFGPLKAIALTKAPVYGDKLFGEMKKQYYGNPVEVLPCENALVVGCAAHYGDLKDNQELLKKMGKLLYVNPLDTGKKDLEVHSHAVTLKTCRASAMEVKAEDVKDAFHMVSDAKINIAKVCVFAVKGVDTLVDLNP